MKPLVLLLKSYASDFEYAKRLVASFHEFNVEALTLYCVVPACDLKLFTALSHEHIVVLSQEEILGQYMGTESLHGLKADYINQEIIKLAFWECGFATNYFCVDSDAVFIREIHTNDFLFNEETPYSVLVQDKELEVEPRYYRDHWVGREEAVRKIMHSVGLEDPIMRTCHGHQIFSSIVLESFKVNFLEPRGWTYRDALAISPYEFSWYCMWLQKSQDIPVHQIEPLVKVFHNQDQHLEYILRGVTTADIARGYLAVVINSNFARGLTNVSVDESKPDALAPYLSYGELVKTGLAKIKETWVRRTGH